MTTSDGSFGDRLRRHRIAAALSQEELAARAGLSVRAISDLERGVHRAPRLETLRLLADTLGLAETDRSDLLAAARPEPATLATGPMALPSLAPLPLPLPPARLIGRETEVTVLAALLAAPDVRLVTLTGPGGTGKTRLAVEVATDVRARYPDSVFLVDLSPLRDPTLVVPTIAATLGVRERAGEPLRQTLTRSLQERRLLLLLDNCEPVIEAAADVATLLAAFASGLAAGRALPLEQALDEAAAFLATVAEPALPAELSGPVSDAGLTPTSERC